jgi:hypothetical protein
MQKKNDRDKWQKYVPSHSNLHGAQYQKNLEVFLIRLKYKNFKILIKRTLYIFCLISRHALVGVQNLKNSTQQDYLNLAKRVNIM